MPQQTGKTAETKPLPEHASRRTHLHTVFRDLGMVVHVPGVMALASPVCMIFAESYARWPFAGTALLSPGLGQLLYRGFRHADERHLYHAMIIAAVGPRVSSLGLHRTEQHR